MIISEQFYIKQYFIVHSKLRVLRRTVQNFILKATLLLKYFSNVFKNKCSAYIHAIIGKIIFTGNIEESFCTKRLVYSVAMFV